MSFQFEFGEASLFDGQGKRKYLAPKETARLLSAIEEADRHTRLFCLLLYYTGCRISEGLALTPGLLDEETMRVAFRTLKRRKRVYRAVPVPDTLMADLLALAADLKPDQRLFPWSRTKGWRKIKELMERCDITGPQATARGFRHRFGVQATIHGINEHGVGTLLGHAPNSKSTHIYLAAVGAEQRALVRRMWTRQ